MHTNNMRDNRDPITNNGKTSLLTLNGGNLKSEQYQVSLTQNVSFGQVKFSMINTIALISRV